MSLPVISIAQMREWERATWETGQTEAEVIHRVGGKIAQRALLLTGDAIQKITGMHIVYQQVAYLMRSGEPDALDRMVAISYASLATDLILRGEFGKMVALREGKYTVNPIDTISQGKKTVDVAELYDSENYRPRVAHILGKPMFLY